MGMYRYGVVYGLGIPAIAQSLNVTLAVLPCPLPLSPSPSCWLKRIHYRRRGSTRGPGKRERKRGERHVQKVDYDGGNHEVVPIISDDMEEMTEM